MRLATQLAVTAFVVGALTTSASAAVNLSGSTGLSLSPGPAIGETMVWNFDSIMDTTHFSYTGNVFSGPVGIIAAPPAGDSTKYGAGEPASAGQAFTDAIFQVKPGIELKSLSFDLGSLDTYNTLSFYSGGTLVRSFTGSQLTATPDGNQASDLTNRRYYFTFGASDDINKVVFSSTFPAFEFDNIAAAISGVPEPATWAMMMLGFGFIGLMMRNNRQKVAIATA